MSRPPPRNDEILTDDYVAGLMVQEAKDCSLKYSALGMEAFHDNKKPTNLPKPNTRFLRHIIKDTDTHNKNLLAKEAAESKARLENLEHAEEAKRLKTNPNTRDIRRRQMGDITAILEGKKRKRGDALGSPARHKDDERDRKSRSQGQSRSEQRPGRSKDLLHGLKPDRRHHGRLRDEDGTDSLSDYDRSRPKPERKRKSTRDGGDSPDDEKSPHRGSHRRARARSRSRDRRRRSRSPRAGSDKHARRRSRSPRRGQSHHQKSRPRSHSAARPRSPTPAAEDSDPLEDLIGPAPAPKHRGRGRLAGSAGIDRRFSESYDPSTDVLMDDGGEEADGNAATASSRDDAIEMFRDRQKLKLAQMNSLRATGRSQEQIGKSQAGGGGSGQTSETDVRWSKKGNEREWDRGKDADEMI